MDKGFFIDKSIASSESNTEEFLIGKKDTDTKKEEILMNGPKYFYMLSTKYCQT